MTHDQKALGIVVLGMLIASGVTTATAAIAGHEMGRVEGLAAARQAQSQRCAQDGVPNARKPIEEAHDPRQQPSGQDDAILNF